MFDAILSRTSRLMISSLFPLAALLGLLPAASALAAAPAQEAVHPNVRIVQEYYAQYAKGNLEGMRALMAPDVEWTIPGHHPLAGTKKGLTEIMAFFKQLQKAGFKAEVLFLGANDRYVVDVHRGWGSYGGDSLDLNWVLVYEIRDGKIARVQNFSGDQHAADAFFWKAYTLKPIQERLQE